MPLPARADGGIDEFGDAEEDEGEGEDAVDDPEGDEHEWSFDYV
jgi:hypothetical protein